MFVCFFLFYFFRILSLTLININPELNLCLSTHLSSLIFAQVCNGATFVHIDVLNNERDASKMLLVDGMWLSLSLPNSKIIVMFLIVDRILIVVFIFYILQMMVAE